MIKLSGPAFAGLDNRLMSLQLVEQNLTDAAMFTAGGEVVQPSEVLYKKPILVERGIEAGALGYVLKRMAGEELIPAVREALRGERHVSQQLYAGGATRIP